MDFANKMCPILSMQMLNKPKSALVGVPPSEPEVIGCQGPGCAWFMQIQDGATGKVVGGTCVVCLVPQALGQLTGTIGASVDRMLPITKEGN